MPAVLRLRTIISKHFGISNEEADQLIGEGRVRVNGKAESPAAKVEYWEEISADEKIIRPGIQFTYRKAYKPRGIECTLNPEIENNLHTVFPSEKKLFPIGRLDKDSEGLLILTDDGRIFTEVAGSEKEKEKEYLVTVDKPVNEEFFRRMSEGIVIMGKKTRIASLAAVKGDAFSFRIILTQGLNRQIRRMCYKLDYKVTRLIRTRIVHIELDGMQAGEWRELTKEELELLIRI